MTKQHETLTALVESINQLTTHVAVMDERQKHTLDAVEGLATNVKIQNGRIGKLERWQAAVIGGAGVIGVVGKIVWDTVTH